MKIAVTSQNRKTVTEHAGRCRKFWIFEIEDNRIISRDLLELPKKQSFHDCDRHDVHPLDEVDVLISAGMGQGLVDRLARRGVTGVTTTERDPRQAVIHYLDGNLEVIRAHARGHGGCCEHH